MGSKTECTLVTRGVNNCTSNDWEQLGIWSSWALELTREMSFGEEALCLWVVHCKMRSRLFTVFVM